MSNLYRVVMAILVVCLMSGIMFSQEYKNEAAKTLKESGFVQKVTPHHVLSTRDALLMESFEDQVIPPTDWQLVSTNAAFTWKINTLSLAYDGVAQADVEYDPALVPQDELLVSPAIDLNGVSDAYVSFWWFASYYWAVDPNNNYDITCEVSTDGGTTWTSLWGEDDFGVFENWIYNNTQLDLSAYAGQTIHLGFRYAGADGAQGDIDYIQVLTGAPCLVGDATDPMPAMGAGGVMASGTTVEWTNAATAAYTELYWGTDPSTMTMVQGDGSTLYSSFDPGMLEYNTEYFWQVVSYETETCYSEGEVWSFKTEFDPAMGILFFDDFESGILNDMYTVVDGNNDGTTWTNYNSSTYAYSGAQCLAVSYNSSMAMDDWVFVGPFNFNGGEDYTLNFMYRVASATWPENMKGHIATATDGTGLVVDLFDWVNFDNTEHMEYSDAFQVPSAGEYYVAFHGYSDADQFRIILDDLMLLGSSGPTVGFMADLNIADNGGAEAAEMLKFGMKEDATDGLDAAYNELELPPVGPAGVFDARFVFPDATTASLVDVRGVADMAEWKFTYQPSDAGFPFTISWDPMQLGEGSFHLTDALGGVVYDVDMKSTNELVVDNTGITTLMIKYSQMISMDMDVAAGWNMVSMPVHGDDMSIAGNFPNATSDAFMFNNGYVTATEMAMGTGYWLKFDAPETVGVQGMDDVMPVAVAEGWNMIGGFHFDMPVSGLTTMPADIIDSDFFGFDNGYSVANTLMPGYGYWVKASAAGELVFDMGPKNKKETEAINGFYGISIATSDNGTGSYALEIGLDPAATDALDSDLGETELPPMPPAGVYDARLVLPDGVTASPKDYRLGDANYSGVVEYDLSWQYSTGGSELTLDFVIPEVPGIVEVTVKDNITGALFTQTVGEGVQQVVFDFPNVTGAVLSVSYTAPVPVELTGFAANVAGEAITLEWTTATETNNKGFEIQRSEDGENFVKVGYVDGNGTTTEAQSYNFTDSKATGGTYFYRLMQVDFDGTFAYSDVVEVEFLPTVYDLKQNFPNPFNPSTAIKFALPVDAKVTITLYNALGQKVSEIINANYAAGIQQINFNASELASGMYIYQISAIGVDGSNFVDTKKMMLMK